MPGDQSGNDALAVAFLPLLASPQPLLPLRPRSGLMGFQLQMVLTTWLALLLYSPGAVLPLAALAALLPLFHAAGDALPHDAVCVDVQSVDVVVAIPLALPVC